MKLYGEFPDNITINIYMYNIKELIVSLTEENLYTFRRKFQPSVEATPSTKIRWGTKALRSYIQMF